MHTVVSLLIALSMGQAAPAANGQLSGRVTAEGTNAAIAGARVIVIQMMRPTTMRTGPMNIPPQGMTDQDGRFVFNNLEAGEYRIDVQKTGIASGLDPTKRPKTYTVAAGQS